MKTTNKQLEKFMSDSKTNGTSIFGSSNPQHRAYPTGVTHNFHIYGPIQELPEYVDMITALTTATENDLIHIYLNTPGGELNTTISIIHAMMRCQGTVVTHADGEVSSAGTMIFLAAPLRIVYPYSHFMFHDASGGAVGKMNENVKRIHAEIDLIEKVAFDIYMPTFSEEEVIEILEGRDYYCDAEEMVDRINAANEAEETSESQSLNEVEDDPEEVHKGYGRARVDNFKLKTYGEYGTIKEYLFDDLIEVKLDSGVTITIKKENLEIL